MTEKEEKILQNFEKLIPVMSELEKEKLISFGEGLIFFKSAQTQKRSEIIVQRELETGHGGQRL